MEREEMALVAKAIGDPIRLRIIEEIRDQERCVCKLLDIFDLKQPNLSYHIRILLEADLIIGRQEGKWNHYRVNEARFRDFLDSLEEI